MCVKIRQKNCFSRGLCCRISADPSFGERYSSVCRLSSSLLIARGRQCRKYAVDISRAESGGPEKNLTSSLINIVRSSQVVGFQREQGGSNPGLRRRVAFPHRMPDWSKLKTRRPSRGWSSTFPGPSITPSLCDRFAENPRRDSRINCTASPIPRFPFSRTNRIVSLVRCINSRDRGGAFPLRRTTRAPTAPLLPKADCKNGLW
jgi:hypothetical protein